jgi:hypothetical protein
MVGVETAKGTRVSMAQDAGHMRLKGRHVENSPRVRYTASVTIGDSVGLTDAVRVQARHGEPGLSSPHIKMYADVLWNHDRQRLERREMTTDSERDYYRQEWFNLQTGERTYFKEGKLSDPDMHGVSARRGKQ